MAKQLKVLALSDREAGQLEKAEDIITRIVARRLQNSSADILTVLDGVRLELVQELARKRAAVKTLIKVANRVLSGDWYILSYSLTNVDGRAEKGKITYTDKNGIERELVAVSLQTKSQPARWIDPAEFPLFYDAETPEERHEALGLAPDCKLITRGQYLALRWIQDLYTEQQTTEQAGFLTIPNTPITTALANIGSAALTKKETVSTIEGDAFKITAKNGVEISISSNAYKESLLKSPNMDKLITQFNYKVVATGTTDRNVALDLDEIMQARGLKDRKAAKAAVAEALTGLYEIRLEYRNDKGSFAKGRICDLVVFDAQRGKRGVANLRYSPEYFAHIKQSGFYGKLPEKMLQIPNNKPNSYNIANAFYRQQRNNLGRVNENVMRVQTLLEYCSFPAYSELTDKGKAAQQIIRPFIKALEFIEEMGIFSFNFCYSKSASKTADCFLTAQDLATLEFDYSLFASLNIKVDWIEKADYSHLIERKQKVKALNEAKAKQGKQRKK